MLLLMYIVELITMTRVTDVPSSAARFLFFAGILCYIGHMIIEFSK